MTNKHVMDSDALQLWLTDVQQYPVSPQVGQRLADVLTSVTTTVQAIDSHGDSIFWTEPTGFDSVLSALSGPSTPGGNHE